MGSTLVLQVDWWVGSTLVLQVDWWVGSTLVLQVDWWVGSTLVLQVDWWVGSTLVLQVDWWVGGSTLVLQVDWWVDGVYPRLTSRLVGGWGLHTLYFTAAHSFTGVQACLCTASVVFPSQEEVMESLGMPVDTQSAGSIHVRE